jgi:2-aminobenzoate-CoA ligase
VSAGETLRRPRSGLGGAHRIRLMDGIGSTEMLHMFIGSPRAEAKPGPPVESCRLQGASSIDEDGRSAARRGRPSRRRWSDRLPLSRRSRQSAQVRPDGWN